MTDEEWERFLTDAPEYCGHDHLEGHYCGEEYGED